MSLDTATQDGVPLAGEPPEQAEEFEAWYTALEPYLPPLVIGPPLTTTSTLTLAVAAQFPPFLVKRGKILFQFPPDQHPLLRQMQHINAMLYHLNGYLMEYLAAMTAAADELQQPAGAPAGFDDLSDPDPSLIWRQGEESHYEPAS